MRNEMTNETPNDYRIVRSDMAGVYYGRLRSLAVDGQFAAVELTDARRIWRWAGQRELAGLATYGPELPDGCRISPAVSVTVLGVCEVITMTPQAVASLDAIPDWTGYDR